MSYRRTHLQEEFAHWLSVVHSVKGRDFVDSHWRHFQDLSDLIHDTYACEAMLSLA